MTVCVSVVLHDRLQSRAQRLGLGLGGSNQRSRQQPRLALSAPEGGAVPWDGPISAEGGRSLSSRNLVIVGVFSILAEAFYCLISGTAEEEERRRRRHRVSVTALALSQVAIPSQGDSRAAPCWWQREQVSWTSSRACPLHPESRQRRQPVAHC